MNEPVKVIQTALFTRLNSLSTKYRSCLLKLVYICGHFFTVNKHRYGRCHVKKFIPLCTFLEFYTHLQAIQQDRFKMLFTNVQWL